MAARRAKPKQDDSMAQLYARAREIDPPAWAERDRLEAERGINPDRMDQRPRSEAEKQMRDRRAYSLKLALDENLAAGDPEVARALSALQSETVN
jgi:hypothetical protein